MADIFISHSGQDNEAAAAIGERIRCERPSWSLFYDKDNIRAGQRWQERLREELTSCRVVLALLSRNWLGSPWCFTEAVTATFRGKDVVGIETEDLTGDDLARAPPILHERQRVRLRDGDDRAWREILEALDRSGLDPNDWFPISPNVGPYPGLVAFDEKDAGVFFGRKQEITEYLGILDTLRGPDRSQVLVISGGSGSGKSSLLRAGLIPRLRRKPDWVVVSPFEVAREPVRNLLDRLGEAFARLGIPADGLDLTKSPDDPAALAQILDETLRRLEQSTSAWVLLPLDQAEVLVTGERPTGDPGRLLLDALAQLLGRRSRHVVVAATIRTEFVPRLEAVFAGTEVRLRQAPLSAIGSLAEVVEKPAERSGIELEPGLSARIVEDVHTADALPLLAYTLKELHDRGGADRRLTLDEYQTLGGVQGAIAAKLETVLSDPEPTVEEAEALKRAFTRYLIRVDEGAVEGERLLRRVVSCASLPPSADRILRRLVDAGLLTTRDGTIELAHERLINDWPKLPLKTWLAQDAADRRLIDQLRERVNDDTLPDGLLAQAEELLQRDHELAAEEPELAQLVQRSREQRRTREWRRRIFLGVASMAALGFAALAGWAWEQRSEAINQTRVSQSRELAALATNQLAIDPVDSVRLARAAAGAGSTSQAGDALRRALFASHGRLVIPAAAPDPAGAPGVVAAFDHGGVAIATARGNGRVELWSVADARGLTSFQTDLVPAFVAFEDEDRALAVTASDGARQVWRIDTERSGHTVSAVPLLAPGRQDGTALSAGALVSFAADRSVVVTSLTTGQERKLPRIRLGAKILEISPDGKWMAVVTEELGDFDAFIVDALTGEVKRRLEGHEDKVSRAAFSPDSQTVATVARWVQTESGGGPSALGDKVARLWNVSSDERPKELRGHTREIRDVSFSPNGNLLLTAGKDETARIWDARTARELTVLRGHQNPVQSATFSADGTRVLTTAEDGGVRLWEAVVGKEVHLQTVSDKCCYKAAFNGDARRVLVVTVGFDDTASVYDPHSGALLLRVGSKTDNVFNASFSPDGESLLTTGWHEIRQHRVPGGEVMRRVSASGECCGERAVMSPDGATLAVSTGEVNTASGGGARLIRDFGGRNEVQNLSPELGASALLVYRANFNHDGRLLVTAGEDYEAAVYAVATGTLLRRLSGAGGHKDRLLQAVFGPGGTIITTSRDTSAILWDSEGKIARILRGHDDAVQGAAFSPDGVLVVTVGFDDTVRVWDVATGTALALLGGLGGVIDAVFSPDGHALLTVSSDAVVRIYPLPAYGSITDMTEMASRHLNLVAR